MKYLYETHLHTSGASACGDSRGHEYIRKYQSLGYSGIIVTNHFYHGNCGINRRLPWEEWVKEFCRDFEDAHNEGIKLGFDVFFGWEENFKGDEYLVYGLDKQWLLDHPESLHFSRKEQYDSAQKYGGCVVQAHPFRERGYIPAIHLAPYCVHGVEVANCGNEKSFDVYAMRYAKRMGLTMTAGSDIHHVRQLDTNYRFGVYLDEKIDSIQGYVSAVRNNTVASLLTTPGRCDPDGHEPPILLSVDIRDENDRSTGKDVSEVL